MLQSQEDRRAIRNKMVYSWREKHPHNTKADTWGISVISLENKKVIRC